MRPDEGIDDYLQESLEDDTFRFVRLSVNGAAGAIVCILIEENWAENAAAALSGYLPPTDESVTIAGDGWVLRVLRSENQDFDTEDFAEQIALALNPTFSDEPLASIEEPTSVLNVGSWGPQQHEARRLIAFVSKHTYGATNGSWNDSIRSAWERTEATLRSSGRYAGVETAVDLLRAASGNDFFDHVGPQTMGALIARDLIPREDYDLLTAQWRHLLGPIHADDPAVEYTGYVDVDAVLERNFQDDEDGGMTRTTSSKT